MKPIFLFFIILIITLPILAWAKKHPTQTADRVLIFSFTKVFRHKNIPEGIAAIRKLGKENNFDVDTSEDASVFTDDQLKKYKAIIFLSPTGDSILNERQQASFKKFIHGGGGFVGIHAATDCLYSWDWYGKLVGAYFVKHPAIQQATLIVTDNTHISTKHLSQTWVHTEEWYNFKNFNNDVKVLIKVDEKTYNGGTMGEFHPISWYHEFDGGRAFYTALGHTAEDFNTDEIFLKHVLGGIKYALGRKQ